MNIYNDYEESSCIETMNIYNSQLSCLSILNMIVDKEKRSEENE